ncbi:transcriptional regulator [Aeromicrobium sp. A1-2]|uniref:FMN-binding negative transcriptional regulator n=1 Tax=Aeromicrobium sp. A1-2 TaxID=2107713 RepID=UPI000E4945AE|nr:FMN-binding negative transcriptional regulator [Aeromicrobium sp. A1-2]AXT85624.1 transcriptional regulator [Aeromicrobium sp. A1-2]
MYIPRANSMDDPAAVRAFVESVGSAEIVTVGPDGAPMATLLPILWSVDGGTVIAHLARANPHWRTIDDGAAALAIVAGPQAYVSPGWYASKAEHGRVVPTWNYSSVHLTGTVRVHDDPVWVRDMVTQLTDRHEQPRPEPWAVTDAPAAYVDKNLRAIVGLEMTVTRVEAKAKLSQNRSDADRAGVVNGLLAEGGDPAVARAMHP